MAYCEVPDVEALTNQEFFIEGQPSIADVEELIANVAAEIDGVIQAAGYTAPATGARAVALLKHYNTLGAAVAAWHADYVSDAAPARVEYWERTYTAFLSRLRRGEQQLPGEDPTSDLDPVFAVVQHPPRDAHWTGRDEAL